MHEVFWNRLGGRTTGPGGDSGYRSMARGPVSGENLCGMAGGCCPRAPPDFNDMRRTRAPIST
jgi:hypothetical protein